MGGPRDDILPGGGGKGDDEVDEFKNPIATPTFDFLDDAGFFATSSPQQQKQQQQQQQQPSSLPGGMKRGFSFSYTPSNFVPTKEEISSMSPLQRTYTALKLERGEDPGILRMKELISAATG